MHSPGVLQLKQWFATLTLEKHTNIGLCIICGIVLAFGTECKCKIVLLHDIDYKYWIIWILDSISIWSSFINIGWY